jgi:hypothetical protein
MPDYVVPVGDTNAPRYRYYTADLVSNTIIGELSLEDVSYQRSLKSPGSFDGKITITDQTNALDLYNATLPGKTAIYVVRDGVCVWGGIVWGRTYDMVGRSLSFSASEFTSYLNHRIVWKAYSQSFEARLTKETGSKYTLVEPVNRTLLNAPEVGEKVRVSFLPSKLRKFTKDYTVVGLSTADPAPGDPGQNSFYVNIPKLPTPTVGFYSQVTVTMNVDTYTYLRDLITSMLSDFEFIQFPNEEITPGIRVPITVTNKQLVTSSSVAGIATLTTAAPHNLILGQKIEIANVDFMLDGRHKVAEIPSPTTFTYVLNNPVNKFDKLNPILLSNIDSTNVSATQSLVKYRQVAQYLEENITHLRRKGGEVTLQLNSQHRFQIGDRVVVSIEGKKPALQKEGKKEVNSFDYSKVNNTVVITDVTSDTIIFTDPITEPDHSNVAYDRPTKGNGFETLQNVKNNTVQLAAPRTLLKVFPQDSDGYAIGEQIQIERVDGYTEPWTNPIFDGYSEIYEVSPGTIYTINNYKIIPDPEITDSFIDGNDTLVYLYLGATNPKIKAGDNLLVRDLNLDATSVDVSFLNGLHTVEVASQLATEGQDGENQYYVYFRFNWDPVAYKGSGSGGKASVDGKSWIAYEPAYSEIKYSVTLKEPDAASNVKNITYKPAAGATKNRVTVTTTDRHNLVVDDEVSIKYAKQEDIDLYGVESAKVISVPDLDVFVYSVPFKSADAKKPIPSKTAINQAATKSGLVTRIKSAVGAPEPVQASFTNAYATSANQGGKATLYSEDHNLSAGDVIYVDVAGDTASLLENDKEPVTITSTTQDTFTYTTNTEIPTIDNMEVRGVGFTTDAGKEVITFDIIAKSGTGNSDRTNSITKVKPKWHKGAAQNSYVTYTTSANTTAVVGEPVIISGLVNAGSITTTTETVTAQVTTLSYLANGGTVNGRNYKGSVLVVGFNADHGLKIDTGFTDKNPAKIKNTVNFSGLSSTQTVNGDNNKVYRVSLSSLNSKNLSVKSVPGNRTLVVAFSGGSKGYRTQAPTITISGVSGVISNNNKISNTFKNFQQFNRAGTVAYVSGSTFSVKYDFLSTTAGNGVSDTDAIGTEYTLSSSGTAAFYTNDFTSIANNSVISISGMQDVKATGTRKKIEYSKLNGVYRIRKKETNPVNYSGGIPSIKVFVLNKLKTEDGKLYKPASYPTSFDATYTDAKYPVLAQAKLEKWQDVSGTAYINLGRLAEDVYPIESVSRTSAAPSVAVYTSPDHGFVVGDYAQINVVGKSSPAFDQGGRPREVIEVSDTQFKINMTQATEISHYSIRDNKVTLFFRNNSAHNLVQGDTISVSVSSSPNINGTKTVLATGQSTVTYATTLTNKDKTAKRGTISLTTPVNFAADYRGSAVPAATIKRVPTVFSRTFGEFPANAAIGEFNYSTEDYSGNSIENTPILGSSLNTVASILDKYSNGIGGFEYRVDCNLEVDINGNKNFTKTFVLVPILPPTMTEYLNSLPGGKLAPGQWAPPAAFGADRVVFEYPGNITNVNMVESAQDSATRMFVAASGSGSGETEGKYSAASDTILLAAGWPLLDKKETATYPQGNQPTNQNVDSFGNYDIETDLNVSANRFLYESKPPYGDITISVNGSLTPVVGSYDPGDWCSIIVNDDFIKNRLNSPLEPRKDVIVRKIDAVKVSVPNNPAFPEMIDLTLVPDWQVDSVGK